MEYVRGTNLREYIERKGPPDLPQALSIMRQAGAAVGAAGEVGLVHRDIKPENLLLTRKGQVKVADFGLCRDLDDDRHHVTQTGVTMGTPLYMSPEQARGRRWTTGATSIRSGVTYYHMLAGQPPFKAETALALAMKHVADIAGRPVGPPARPPARARPAGDEADGQGTRRPIPIGRRDAPRPGQDPRGDPGFGDDRRPRPPDRAGDPTPADAIDTADQSPTSVVDGRDRSGSTDPRLGRRLCWPRRRSGSWRGPSWAGWRGRRTSWRPTPGPTPAPRPSGSRRSGSGSAEATPAAQYRHAQILADSADREAAWVAVSGYHPGTRCGRLVVTQLARELFRRRDRSGSGLRRRPGHDPLRPERSPDPCDDAGIAALDGTPRR